ncbi:MAG: alpha-L-fucosidase [Saprospiraceae bacterium]|nr:alpha-L-fucosidase [Saprospiraceae bacterium]
MKVKVTVFLQIGLLILLALTACQSPQTDQGTTEVDYLHESQEDLNARMEWWRDARFGMFVHWGLYAIPAGIYQGDTTHSIGEWIMETLDIPVSDYEKLAGQFNPVQFDADAWAQLAANAGMKYLVITSKHHDGFCLWDSEVSQYDIMDASPYQKDILGALKTACDKAGVKLCFYHSIMDWHHPQAQSINYPDYNSRDKMNPEFDQYRDNYLRPQLRELLAKYDPGVLWFDGEWIPEWTEEQGKALYNELRNIKPSLIINNRVGKGRQGMQGMNKADQNYAGDFGTPEQEILTGTSEYDWESCMTMNDTWGYKSIDHNWKSTRTLIHNLVDCAAKGGNYLLNVGPTAEGLIPATSVERLQEIGKWMQVNGEAIYATRRHNRPYQAGESAEVTYSKDGKVAYVIALDWPGKDLSLGGLKPAEGSTVQLLGVSTPLSWSFAAGQATVAISDVLQDPANRPCDYAWVFKVNLAD